MLSDYLLCYAGRFHLAVIVAEYDGVLYVEKEITDHAFTGTPVDFPPLEKACSSLPHNAADGK